MSDENNIVLLLSLLVFTLIIFMLAQQISKQKLKQQIRRLENLIQDFQTQLQNKTAKTSSPSHLNLEYIKKIEELEEELKLQKRRLLETKAIAQEANRVKSQFLSNIRHEIRTPMNSIMVFADLLAQETLDEKLKSYTKNISVSGQKLLSLLDDIIELSSVEKGTYEIEETPVDIRECLAEITKKEEKKAKKKGLDFDVLVAENIPDVLLIDRPKVEEIIQNLIENAIRFTDKGFIKISLQIDGKNILKNTVNLCFTVEDSGIGIEKQDLEKIFEIFETADINDKKIRGAGLGLSLNKKLAQAMNGDIQVFSEIKKGSKFVFTLQDVEVALGSFNREEINSMMIDFSRIESKYKKIVVIETDSISKSTIQEAFLDSSIKVYTFEQPREAIAMLKKEPVDIIFVDIGILTEDESAVAKILTKISDAAIVSITSKRIKDIDLIHGIRLAGHLMRPIHLAELFKVTLKAMSFTHKFALKKELYESTKEILQENNLQNRQAFLVFAKQELDALYTDAYKTNDLKLIEIFAKKLYEGAMKYDIKTFIDFSDTLLQKIELFDIDAIHSMMKEYKEKLYILKSL